MEVNENPSTNSFIPEVPKDKNTTPDESKTYDEHKDDVHSMTDSVDSTVQLPFIPSASEEQDDTKESKEEDETQSPVQTEQISAMTDMKQDALLDPITVLSNSIYFNNAQDVASSSLKHIAKMITAIHKNPTNKKNRQIRTDNILIKKFVTSVKEASKLFSHLGFHEEIIDNKSYQVVDEDYHLIPDYGTIATYLTDFVADAPTIDKSQQSTSKTVETTQDFVPRLPCRAPGCKFYGSEETNNLCSVCYKKKQTITPSKTVPKPEVKSKTRAYRRLRAAMIHIRATCRFKRVVTKREQIHKDRCWSCNRKLGITGTECRCGYIFCGKHRYADEHNCTFDHYARHQQALEKANQKVTTRRFD